MSASIGEKITRMEGEEYVLQQIKVMISEGVPADDAIRSMETELATKRNEVAWHLENYAALLKFQQNNPT